MSLYSTFGGQSCFVATDKWERINVRQELPCASFYEFAYMQLPIVREINLFSMQNRSLTNSEGGFSRHILISTMFASENIYSIFWWAWEARSNFENVSVFELEFWVHFNMGSSTTIATPEFFHLWMTRQ